MKRKYADPRYHKKLHTGRKPLPEGKHRQLVSARVAPETAQVLRQSDVKLGSLIDQWAREKLINDQAEFEKIASRPACETMVMDDEDGTDLVLEMARGLLEMIANRGTSHLTVEQVDMLSANFSLLINNYAGTFKKKLEKTKI